MLYMSVQALYGAAKALYWNSSAKQNSVNLTLFKHQNTKTSLYKVSKNHWVFVLFLIFGSARKKLQSTVSFDHPVASIRINQNHSASISTNQPQSEKSELVSINQNQSEPISFNQNQSVLSNTNQNQSAYVGINQH